MATVLRCLAVLAALGVAAAVPFRHDPFNPLGPWHKRTLHCGLPRFLHKLPEATQEKIKAIWADYQDGEECFKEMKQTREAVHELPAEVRHKIFKGMCGPSFLKNASATVRAEFKKVWFDPHLSIDEKELAFKRLAYSLLSGDALQQFVKWEAELQERKHERNDKVAKLSPAAREAYDKWMSLRKDERVFLNSLSTEIRSELRLICGFCGSHKHGSGPGDKETAAATTAPASTTALPDTTTEVAAGTESPKTETEKFFKFHDDSLDEFLRRSQEALMNDAECSAYVY